MQFLTDKLQKVFKIWDLNHDKILNRFDLEIQQNVFVNVYNLDGHEANRVKEQLNKFWNCETLYRLDKGLTMKNFVANITHSYRRNKTKMIRHIQECVNMFFNVIDHNNDGYMTIDELSLLLKGFKNGNKKLLKKRFKQMCPDACTNHYCPLKNGTNYMVEFLIGDDREIYSGLKKSFSDVGMSLDDMVE